MRVVVVVPIDCYFQHVVVFVVSNPDSTWSKLLTVHVIVCVFVFVFFALFFCFEVLLSFFVCVVFVSNAFVRLIPGMYTKYTKQFSRKRMQELSWRNNRRNQISNSSAKWDEVRSCSRVTALASKFKSIFSFVPH